MKFNEGKISQWWTSRITGQPFWRLVSMLSSPWMATWRISCIRDACISPSKQVLWLKKGKSGYVFCQCSTFPLNWKKTMWVEFNQLGHFRNVVPGLSHQDAVKHSLCCACGHCFAPSCPGKDNLTSQQLYLLGEIPVTAENALQDEVSDSVRFWNTLS